MAAKHDAKKARGNHWVMQQNLAKQKGGRPLYQAKPKQPKLTKGAVTPKAAEATHEPATEPKPEVPEATE